MGAIMSKRITIFFVFKSEHIKKSFQQKKNNRLDGIYKERKKSDRRRQIVSKSVDAIYAILSAILEK